MVSASKTSRDNFPQSIKRVLADRVGHCCSKPDCGAPTKGPKVELSKASNVGVAAHIAGAAPGGPRYDPTMTPQQRAAIANGIWLCQTCATLVDNDEECFPIEVLKAWKTVAEQKASALIGKPVAFSMLAAQIVDKWVDYSYPEKAGTIKELAAQGYHPCWTTANDESERIDIQGWEVVLLDQTDGTKARLKIHDHSAVGGYMIFLKKKNF